MRHQRARTQTPRAPLALETLGPHPTPALNILSLQGLGFGRPGRGRCVTIPMSQLVERVQMLRASRTEGGLGKDAKEAARQGGRGTIGVCAP